VLHGKLTVDFSNTFTVFRNKFGVPEDFDLALFAPFSWLENIF
jgi:hypothetical protein